MIGALRARATGCFAWRWAVLAGPGLVAGCSPEPPALSLTDIPGPCDASTDVHRSLHFDGVTDFMTTGTAGFPTASDRQTLSMWVRPSDLSGQQTFVTLRRDVRSGVTFGIRNGNIAAWAVFGDHILVQAALSPAATATTDWHHVAYVQDIADAGMLSSTLYIDGVAVAMGDGNTNNLNPLFSWIGSFDGEPADAVSSDGAFFGGNLDEIRIWAVARTPAGILEDMQGTVTPGEPGLVAYFNCSFVCGTRMPDLSGNGNDATLGGGNPSYMPTLAADVPPLRDGGGF
ncbi:MAG: LamG domain-containing protein [Polyangiaceae bacterium]